MTRKDYIALAAAIRRARDLFALSAKYHAGVDATADFIADALAADNPRFDRDRFMDACGRADENRLTVGIMALMAD